MNEMILLLHHLNNSPYLICTFYPPSFDYSFFMSFFSLCEPSLSSISTNFFRDQLVCVATTCGTHTIIMYLIILSVKAFSSLKFFTT